MVYGQKQTIKKNWTRNENKRSGRAGKDRDKEQACSAARVACMQDLDSSQVCCVSIVCLLCTKLYDFSKQRTRNGISLSYANDDDDGGGGDIGTRTRTTRPTSATTKLDQPRARSVIDITPEETFPFLTTSTTTTTIMPLI